MLIAGRYQVLRELGSGGMGVVYLASHVEIERQCALKMLRPEAVAEPEALARFHREARSASRISHPNVVAVHDFGKTEDGRSYLAMEYVEGQTLEKLLEAGPLEPRRAARIIWQAANGLAAAHELGIVHRDLKPGNIMLTKYRSWDDFVKVVDFGIAKPMGATTRSNVTTTGLRVGTPAYMSPEQWLEGVVDQRGDLFSLGLIAVELLAGKLPPFQSALLTSGRQVIDAIPAAAQWPEKVKAVLAKALSPAPEQRHATVQQFAGELVAAVNEWVPPVPGVREPWDERLGTTMSHAAAPRRRWIGAVAAGVLVLAAGGAWLAWNGGDSGTPAPRDSGTSALGNSGTSALPDSSTSAPRNSGTSAPRHPGTPAPRHPGTLADSLSALRTMFSLDRPDADSARRVVAIATGLLARPLPDSARVEAGYRLAEVHLFLGETDAACAALTSARPLAERTGYLARSIAALVSRNCPTGGSAP